MNKEKDFFKLRQTVRFFESLLHSSVDGIVITDSAQNIIFVNDTFCNLFSTRRQNLLETCISVWIGRPGQEHRDVFREWNSLATDVQKLGIARNAEFLINTEAGTKHFAVNASLVKRIGVEEPGTIISIWRDIALRKQRQETPLTAYGALSSCCPL